MTRALVTALLVLVVTPPAFAGASTVAQEAVDAAGGGPCEASGHGGALGAIGR